MAAFKGDGSLTFLYGPAFAQNANDDATQDVILVLDGSGSMWGQIDGKAKIEIAREVIDDLFTTWPEATDLGLIAYGHRREKDCADIETLLPLGDFEEGAAREAVQTITPKGRTPLTDAVRQAVSQFAEGDQRKSVMLVTDGLETCGGDPCMLGRELAESRADLTVHVVGFDLGKEDTGALRCLAIQTGGNYYPADSATELGEALGQATQAATKDRNVTFIAIDADRQPMPADANIYWFVYQLTDEGEKGERLATLIGRSVNTSLSPGRYLVEANEGEDATQRFEIEVVEGQPLVKEIVFANGSVYLTAHLTAGTPALTTPFTWVVKRLAEDGTSEDIAREAGDDVRFTLAPGRYQGQVQAEDLRVDFDLPVEGGVEREQQVVLNAGFINVTGPSGSSWTLFRVDEDGTERRAASEARASTTFLVTAGTYIAENRMSRALERMDVTLAAGETVEVNLAP